MEDEWFPGGDLCELMGGGAGLAAIGACDAFAIEPRFALTVKHWRIPHPQWPAAARPLRIGILTDLHAIEPYMPVSRIGEIVERLNGLQPDIIVLLGDYVASLQRQYYTAKVPVAAWVAALAPLKAPLGVYAVLGNHDWWAGEAGAIRQAFARTGIHLLENAAVKIPHGQHAFWLAGLGDQLAHHKRGVDDLPGTLKQVRDNAPVILMAHEPDIFPKVPARVTLTLSGHTHGGQVYLPFLSKRYIHSRYGGRYSYGHIVENGRHLVVSAGLGVSIWPVRFMVPPEITLVTLSGIEATA